MSAADYHEEETPGRVYDRHLAGRLLARVRPYWRLVVGAVLLLLVEGLLQLVGPLLTKRVIDEAIPAGDAALVMQSAVIFGAALVAQFACGYGQTILTALVGQRVMRDLRNDLFAHLQRLPVPFFDRNPVGRLVTRVTSDVESLNELFTAGVVAGLGDLFALGAIGVLMVVADWRLALAAFAVIPFVVITSRTFQRHVRAAYRDIRARLARINAFLQERITGMQVVQLFGRERDERSRFARLNEAHLAAPLRSVRVYALYLPVIEVLTSVALASLIVGASGRVATGALTVGTVAAFLQLVRRFFQPLQDLSDKYNTLQQAMAASERIFGLLDTPAEPARVPLRHPARRDARGATVEFEDVWFAYDVPRGPGAGDAEPRWVLRAVSFVVRPGETLALVGHTGAGKTTVLGLLLRFYEPQRGRILLDGVDIRELSLEELRGRLAYVQQDIFLFAADIASNIRLGASLSDADVAAVAARVGADRVVRRLPHGYDQVLGERGSSLSVGERQLLSFARAIAADPDLLLLDEATSAVDSETEAAIQEGLRELMRGRTTIAVAHRLSTIVNATEILVLHHGQVRERGTHREL
ncbi:MAG TPA: ABC transporter ATP-binding protein, partial [Gemmatimonadaceae bacterium]|nr:ABC transporter ATP-binding protein [Gemmatimonadaceae bacterium]